MNSKGSSTKSPKRVENRAPAGRRPVRAATHQAPPEGKAHKPPARAAAGAGPAQEPASGFVFYSSPHLTLICLPDRAAAALSLLSAAERAGVHPDLLLYYCRLGLLGADRARRGARATFDEAALEEVSRIEHYRRHLGVQRRALPLVCALWREGERRHIGLRFLEPTGGYAYSC